MKVILATHNRHKITEISDVLKDLDIEVKSLLDYPDVVLPEETGSTFVDNARVKSQTVYNFLLTHQRTNLPAGRHGAPTCQWILGDDSGLVVDALGGRPGIYSSRYSGEPVDYKRNNKKLLSELKGVSKDKRTAHFVCSIVMIDPSGKEEVIEGRCSGFITEEEKGVQGFGYDPVFYVPSFGCTMAEVLLSDKNRISHRGLAVAKAKKILVGAKGFEPSTSCSQSRRSKPS